MNCSGYSCRFLTNDYFFRLFRCQMFANLQACLDADNPLWNWWIDIGYWRGYWSMRPIICTEFTKSKFTACFMEIVCRRRNIGVMGMHKNWIMKEWDVLWMAHRKTLLWVMHYAWELFGISYTNMISYWPYGRRIVVLFVSRTHCDGSTRRVALHFSLLPLHFPLIASHLLKGFHFFLSYRQMRLIKFTNHR